MRHDRFALLAGLTPALTMYLALALAGPALAKDRQVIRDESGHRVGTVEKGVGDRQIIRDESGRRVGTVEPGVGGRQVIRDKAGKRVGTVDKR